MQLYSSWKLETQHFSNSGAKAWLAYGSKSNLSFQASFALMESEIGFAGSGFRFSFEFAI